MVQGYFSVLLHNNVYIVSIYIGSCDLLATFVQDNFILFYISVDFAFVPSISLFLYCCGLCWDLCCIVVDFVMSLVVLLWTLLGPLLYCCGLC